LFAGTLALAWCGAAAAAEARPEAEQRADLDALARVAPVPSRALCVSGRSGQAQCLARVVTVATGADLVEAIPRGLGPRDLQSAYALPPSGGHGRVVAAILPPYDYPNAVSDLEAYRQHFGLAAAGTPGGGSFLKVDQNGGTSFPPPETCEGGAAASALNVQILSATCPDCTVLLIEPNSASDADLGAALTTAIRMGAVAISASYSEAEAEEDLAEESIFGGHGGTLITVPGGEAYPATSSGTLAVGGTTLARSSSSRGWAEAAWSAGGCSAMISKPSWQTDVGCATRAANDVSAVADPASGVSVYCTDHGGGGWRVLGGASVPAPLVAGAFTVTGVANGHFSPSWVWSHGPSFFDVVADGALAKAGCSPAFLCRALPGYDSPTGWGTPNGALLAASLTGASVADPTRPASPSGPSAATGCGCTAAGAGGGAGGAFAALGALLAGWGVRRRRRGAS
jgi:MYXO-CTERM domain-containing protein